MVLLQLFRLISAFIKIKHHRQFNLFIASKSLKILVEIIKLVNSNDQFIGTLSHYVVLQYGKNNTLINSALVYYKDN